ncbi:MAG: hypothetical protein ACM37W_01570 [Actinomycetota bacterium]
MEAFGNTLEINVYNYNETISQICGKLGTDKEELSFLKYFGQETAPHFQRQIKADLIIALVASIISSAGAWWIAKEPIKKGDRAKPQSKHCSTDNCISLGSF